MNRYWRFDVRENRYAPAETEPLSVFPTIVNAQTRTVFCRAHRRWENIAAFRSNVLKSACGSCYAGPFTPDETVFNYGYDVTKRGGTYYVLVRSQTASTARRLLLENRFELDTEKKRLYKNGVSVLREGDAGGILCTELTMQLLDEIGERHRSEYGIKPTVTSSLRGFSLLLGYLLCPFNVNFYRIARHWGLNPCDADFTSLSSGDTPSAENEMFESLGIRPTKSLRKLYQKMPESVVCYAAAKDLGFTDTNVLRRSARTDFYTFLSYYMISFAEGGIDYQVREGLRAFATDMLASTSQTVVWNSIERTAEFFASQESDIFFITDGLNMYRGCSPHLSEREKKEIMREGFNRYTHDFLLRRHQAMREEIAAARNAEQEAREASRLAAEEKLDAVPFPLEQAFLSLEYKSGDAFYTDSVTKERKPVPDEERWCFYLAKDGADLKAIGSEMSNCVGWGYRDAVMERRATIVYALHKGKYKICIEVTPSFTIRQAFGPHNSELTGEAFEAYSEWCREKHILRRKAFAIHGAPL